MIKRLILFIIYLSFSASLCAQADLSKMVDLSKKYTNAIELLDTLAARTGLQFSYRSSLLQKKIKIRKGVRPLQEIIDYLCSKTNSEYSIINSTVVIKEVKQGKSNKTIVISGKIVEDSTGEAIPYAYLYIENTSLSYKTTRHGYFSFIAPPRDSFTLFCVSAYESAISIQVNPDMDSFLVIVMPKPKPIKSVILKKGPNNSMTNEDDIGIIKMTTTKLTQLPPFLGEHDIINALTFSPGVTKGTEGNNGLFIRGGSPDQNLITLDGALLYNPNHFFGLFSPFNSDAINHITMQKSGFGADIGGRLSSHLAIDLKEGNKFKHQHNFSISPIAITGSSNGPIKSPKTTYLVSFRRSYFDLLFTPLISKNNSLGFFFYDLNGKVTHHFNKKHKISVSIFAFQDKAFNKSKFERKSTNGTIIEENDQSLSWGNNLAQINYSGQIRKNVFLSSDIYYTSFKYKNNIAYSLVEDSSGKQTQNHKNTYDFNSNVFSISSNHGITWWATRRLKTMLGLGYFYHSFLPSNAQFFNNNNATLSPSLVANKEPTIFANETYAYAQLNYIVGPKLELNGGLRYSSYHTTRVNYFNPQPRFSAKIALPKSWYLKPSITQTVQYLHFSTNNTIGVPVDLWLPATKKLKPETSQQANLQIQKLHKNADFSVDIYYKLMNNLIDYAEGIEYLGISNFWEDKFVQGKGITYGVDVMLEKKLGNFKGWFGYSWSVNNRQFDSINGGNIFPFKYDRRNNISVVITTQLRKNLDFYTSWVYGSGSAITLPIGRYPNANNEPFSDIYIYGKRNSNRLRDYHRLDMGLKSTKIKKHFTRIWNISVYNLYNRQNPFYITPGSDKDGNRSFIQVSLLPFIPSVSYRIEIN
jgi:hypothetical protein